jgi:cytochrome c biogenesis protein CcmG, thiol:disulfide interchange protein DsbE
MKKIKAMKKLITLILAIAPALWTMAQTNNIPNSDLRDPDGKKVSSSEVIKPGAATLVVFWKSNNNACCANLETLEEAWSGTLRHQGVRMVVICTDCNGNWTTIKPIVNGNGWEFETYIDVNGDFKRAMNVGEGPCTILFDQDENQVCRYNSACTGTPEYICGNFMAHLGSPLTEVELRAGK